LVSAYSVDCQQTNDRGEKKLRGLQKGGVGLKEKERREHEGAGVL